MARYKARVCADNAKQYKKDAMSNSNIPDGTWYVKVLFECKEKWIQDHEEWTPCPKDENDKLPLNSKTYFLSHDVFYETKQGRKSQFQTSKYWMERDLGFTGKDSELQELVDTEVELITEPSSSGYENITKIIGRGGGRKPLVEEGKEQEFASIFNR